MVYRFARDVARALGDVTEAEVYEALQADKRLPIPAIGMGEERVLSIWGRTRNGKALSVVVWQQESWDWVILQVRALQPDEAAFFARWEAER